MKVWQANTQFIFADIDNQIDFTKNKSWASIQAGEPIYESELTRTIWVKGHPFDMYGLSDAYQTRCTMIGTIPENNGVPGSSSGAPSGTLVYKGDITVAADFPTLADVLPGWVYRIVADVTDNNPAKTNTGLSFTDGDEIFWVGSTWASSALPLPATMVNAAALLASGEVAVGDGARGVSTTGLATSDIVTAASNLTNGELTIGDGSKGVATGGLSAASVSSVVTTVLRDARSLMKGWNLAPGNPIITGTKIYYPDMIFNASQPFSYLGTNYAWFAMASEGLAKNNSVWLSNDFVTWVGPISTNIPTGYYHTEVLYIPGDPKPFKAWFWNGGGITLLANHYFTQSANGFTWDAPTLLLELNAGRFARTGFCTAGYGMTCLHYNPTPTNTGGNPHDYKYWGTMNGQYVPTGGEFVVPVFSTDGIRFEMLPFAAVRPTADYPLLADFANYKLASWHPHMSWLDFDQVDTNYYIGMMSGGRDGATSMGMTLVESMDGIFWQPVTYSPMAMFGWSSIADTSTPRYYEGPTYAQFRSGDMCVWYEPSGFGSFAPAGAKLAMMWGTQTASADTSRCLSVAWHNMA